MKAQHVFLLCVLGAALLSTVLCSNGIGPDDCCFKFYRRQIRKLNILTQTPNWVHVDFRGNAVGRPEKSMKSVSISELKK
uniref:Chemokine interleukin-8-like domain-containing protein n=1 Tax=Xiphophorus couchianus TaxID=32473 RepID=A0A3B5LA39_9TELE